MRNAFAAAITRLAAIDPRVVLLSGDIGNRLFDEYRAKFANRFYNCGVAEANMMGVAAGLAATGLRPFVYTIAPFVTTRVMEQIRVDLCYGGRAVVLVGTGAGLSYGELGATHHSCEDIAMLRTLPSMAIVCPADPTELECAIADCAQLTGPMYLRIGKKGEPRLHSGQPNFVIGKAIEVRKSGSEVVLVCTGSLLEAALGAADALEKQGYGCTVVSMHTVKPLDCEYLAKNASSSRLVITMEEHSRIGGLGSAIAEWWVDQPTPLSARLLRLGTPDEFVTAAHSQEHLRAQYGLTAEAIAAKALDALSPGVAVITC